MWQARALRDSSAGMRPIAVPPLARLALPVPIFTALGLHLSPPEVLALPSLPQARCLWDRSDLPSEAFSVTWVPILISFCLHPAY